MHTNMIIQRKLRCRKNASSSIFCIGFIGLLLTVFFICVGLSLKTGTTLLPTQDIGSNFTTCFDGDVDDHLVDNDTRIVLMLVDAWRLSFLTDSESSMVFLRELINSGQAVAFVANVQTPTVTMPRIKALTGGTVPSLISLVTNFFATASVEENWVTSAAAAGRRITFFGDDTWLRLFTGAFTEAEGVTSFFVNDYTEVDNNVTRHLSRVLATDNWDILILHYLGLDHIGHSLGRESPQIRRKLSEMDSIARRIIHLVTARSPLLFIMAADHGMNDGGSHGGGSEAECRVPVLFFHSNAEVIKRGNFSGLTFIEQVDLASTLPFFLGTKIPSESIGLSLVPLLAEQWKLSDFTVFSAAVQSYTHFSRYVFDHALHLLAKAEDSELCRAAKVFVAHARNLSTMEQKREVQRMIIRSKEDILQWPVFVGLALSFATLFVSSVPQQTSILSRAEDMVETADYMTYFVFVLYHISSYSTSLIEEEHDIWYYILSSIILLRIFPSVTWRLGTLDFSKMICRNSKVIDEFLLLCLHRLAISFTMSKRRRWSMTADLLPPEIVPEFRFGNSFLDNILTDVNISEHCRCMPIATVVLCTAYISWRLQVRITKYGRLLVLMYFLPIIICCKLFIDNQSWWIFYTIVSLCALTSIVSFPLGVISYLIYLVRPETLPLLLICFEMGALAYRASLSPYLIAFLNQTVFFYTGQSSNISSIDIAVGYKGLSSYIPAVVLFQILANFYSSPIAFTLGYSFNNDRSEDLKYNVMLGILHLRCVTLFSALTGIICLSGHLFMFSVLSPKLVCEILHAVTALFLTGSTFCVDIILRKIILFLQND